MSHPSTASEKFILGHFVIEGTTGKVGTVLAIRDEAEANPLVLVQWFRNCSVRWVRSEYLSEWFYPSNL